MKISIKTAIVLFLTSTLSTFSQENLLKKADNDYTNYAYSEAITKYKKIVNNGNGTVQIYQHLGDCYFYNSKLEEASKWYLKMLQEKKESDNVDAEYYFRTALTLKASKNYKKADSLLLAINSTDSRVKRLLNNPNYLEDIKIQTGRYQITNFSENSPNADFAPSMNGSQLVFASSRSKKNGNNQDSWTEEAYLSLFTTVPDDSKNPIKTFSKELNSKLHESTATFSKDGTVVYFTGNDLTKTTKETNSANLLKIYKASLNEKSKWTDITVLSINGDDYSIAHPSLNTDETKLYFASDMPGGYGMSDIYVVDIYKDGSFGTPKNLGPNINTEGRDTFPFISSKDVLYFASDGHLGLGGLDIFTVNNETVYNVGKPINSPADDISFIIDETTGKGYFASNRTGGHGEDDLYSFVQTKPLVTNCNGSLTITAIDEKSNKILSNATVEVIDNNNAIIFSGITDEKGQFVNQIDCNNKKYSIRISKENYHTTSSNITIVRTNTSASETLKLTPNIPEKGVDLAKLLDLQPIYFATNKALITDKTAIELNKVVMYMREYPTIKIEIGSHTDSRGSDQYNLKLSDRRAASTANYIIKKGIDKSRVKNKGYGETKLTNNCSNGVKCSKEQHAKNRRSEFIVVDN